MGKTFFAITYKAFQRARNNTIWYQTNPHKRMRVDAWVKPFFAITYKANNAQGIIPFGIRPELKNIHSQVVDALDMRINWQEAVVVGLPRLNPFQ